MTNGQILQQVDIKPVKPSKVSGTSLPFAESSSLDIRDKTIDVAAMDKLRIEEARKEAQGNDKPQGNGDKKTYGGEHIVKALNDAFDRLYESAALRAILLGDIAKACRESKPFPQVEQIEFALPQSALTYEVKSLFTTWNFRKTKFGYEYEFSIPLQWDIKVPVKIYVYKEKYRFFEVPDRVWAGVDGAFVPNPFDEYWKMRNKIQRNFKD